MAFYFDKPPLAGLVEGGSEGFEFKAGQFVEMTLLNPLETDAGGNTRAFTIASAPHEPDLMIATRMRDTAFKRVLKTLTIGTEAQIEGPFGSFHLTDDASRPAVFLMGGIGITPARSIVYEAAREKLPHKIFLFYANRQPKDAAFFQELKNLETENSHYKFIPTMTDVIEGDVSWAGERGYITGAMLKKHLGTLEGAVYYSAGPQAMVSAMRKVLNGAGVDDDDIRTEEFGGY